MIDRTLSEAIRSRIRRLPSWMGLLGLGSLLGITPARGDEAYVVRESSTPCLRLRSEPESDASVVDCLPPGKEVTAFETVPFWRHVRLADGRTGWVAKKFLEPAAPAPPASVPGAIPENAWLEVHFVDVGQGDGIWIHTFDDGIDGNGIFEGRNIIIDGGPDASDEKNQMLKYLEGQGHHNGTIDALIVTHAHIDHFPGAEGILRHFEVRTYYDSGYPKGGIAYPHILEEVKHEHADGQPIVLKIGRSNLGQPDWGRELDVSFLYAYPGSAAGLGAANTLENNASIVLRLAYGEQSSLFMGDAEGKDRSQGPTDAHYVEKILLDTVPPDRLKATVLKLAHHGSETSSSLPFIAAVDPEVIVICSGRKKFRTVFLPDESVIGRYCAHNPNIQVCRTDQDDEAEGRSEADDADGDNVVIRSNGHRLEIAAQSHGTPVNDMHCHVP